MLDKLENLSEIDKKILEVSKQEFLEHGFFKTNLDNIALKLKIGKGTIYRHFGKKHTLFLSIVAYMLKQNWVSSKELISKELDFHKSFDIFIDNLINFNKETSRFFSAVFSEQVWNEILKAKKKDKQIKELMDFIMNCRKNAIDMIAEILEKGKKENLINKNVNSLILGEIILITLNQFILSFFMEKKLNKIEYSIEEATKVLKEFILRGIGYKNI
ncbi:MAG: TetR/AcrR family transcriptional regulator [Brevinematia bacterium]